MGLALLRTARACRRLPEGSTRLLPRPPGTSRWPYRLLHKAWIAWRGLLLLLRAWRLTLWLLRPLLWVLWLVLIWVLWLLGLLWIMLRLLRRWLWEGALLGGDGMRG